MAEGLSFKLTGTAAQSIALEAQADDLPPAEQFKAYIIRTRE